WRWRQRGVLPGPETLGALLLRQHLAMVDPDLDAADAKGRVRLRHAEVDVGAQRLQRHAALDLFLGARDLGAAQATARDDTDTLRARAHRLLHRLFHRAAERDALLELLGDRARHQRRVHVGVADLQDVQAHLLLRQALQLLAQTLDALAAAANDDARLGGVNRDADLRPSHALDLD